MEKRKKRELIEWVVLIVVVSVIYLGGWHTEVIGRLQQAVLYTGIITPNEVEEEVIASYDFELKSMDGEIVSFSSFQDKVVFLNFWATWCPPCIAEMPDIHNLYENTSDSVSFVMISLDQDHQKAKDFIKNKEFDFPVYFLNSSLPKTYNTSSIPTTYVISKEGKIKVENHGMAKYNSKKFRKLLSELQKRIMSSIVLGECS